MKRKIRKEKEELKRDESKVYKEERQNKWKINKGSEDRNRKIEREKMGIRSEGTPVGKIKFRKRKKSDNVRGNRRKVRRKSRLERGRGETGGAYRATRRRIRKREIVT